MDQMMQTLQQFQLPSCITLNHVDNLILIRNDIQNDRLLALCGQCNKENNQLISTKHLLQLIIEKIHLPNYQQFSPQQWKQRKDYLKLIETVIELLQNTKKLIHKSIKDLIDLQQNITQDLNQATIGKIKIIISDIFSHQYEHPQFQTKINELSKLIKLNTNQEKQPKIDLKPYRFDKTICLSHLNTIDGQLMQIKNIIQMKQTFDTDYSQNYFKFEKDNQIAIFMNNSKAFPNEYSNIQGYMPYPAVRVNYLIQQGIFTIKFRMSSGGYFGLGTPNLPSNGFPGYTPFGYVHPIKGGISYYNNLYFKEAYYHLTNSRNASDKDVIFTVYADSQECSTMVDGELVTRKYPLPNPVYIIFSLPTNDQVELIN